MHVSYEHLGVSNFLIKAVSKSNGAIFVIRGKARSKLKWQREAENQRAGVLTGVEMTASPKMT